MIEPRPARRRSPGVRVAVRIFAGLAALLPARGPCPGEVITLQQGLGSYKEGCVTKTLWAPKTKKPKGGATDAVLYIRGTRAEAIRDPATALMIHRETSNRVLIKFELPAGLRGLKLARARLEVFVPETRNVRMINEILCREVTQAWTADADWYSGGSMDVTTDYRNGRPKGAVDSFSFWEFNGRWFPHKYAFLQCPKGGRWIDFNITPLVAKWLKDPASNHGVALHPITQKDKRFPNRIEIDIPSADSPDRGHRPRLVVDCGRLGEDYLVGMTHGLRKYCDRSTRYRFSGPFVDDYELSMARNEFEPFQVIVYPLAGDLKAVRFEWTDLVGPGGAKIPAADVKYDCQEMVQMHPNGKTGDWYFHGKEFWIPDPLSTAKNRPIDLRRHVSTPFWFTVRTRPETKAGWYRGTITVKCANALPQKLSLTVKVWNYQIPQRWNFQTMGQTCWEWIWRAYPGIDKAKKAALRKKYLDFLLDRRFMPTRQYADVLSPSLEDIPYCIERGGNTIYLSGNYRGNVQTLRRRYDAVIKLDKKLRAEGKLTGPERLIDMSLVYIGDETNKWDLMRSRSNEIRRACPELMIMIGGSFPRAELDGVIDIYDPQIGGSSKTYSLAEQMTHLIAKSQARGERFFWYDAAGPMLPYPNVQCEEPLIASRLVFWTTWKYGVTGFEYYCYAIWRHNLPDKDGRRWPDKPFSPWGWGNTNGDGMLFYPGPDGPFSSVRFENIRDGIEDWESHFVLRDYTDALRKKGAVSAQAKAALAGAEKLLKVPDPVVRNLTDWTWDPNVLLVARAELGQMIESLTELVSPEEMLAARAARKLARLQRQRDMLKRRAEKARKAAGQGKP